MSLSVTPFNFDGASIRFFGVDDAVEIVAPDVCGILGIAHVGSALRSLDADEKGVRDVHTPGGVQQVSVITEPGLYKLIARSRKPEAKRFDRWVRHEVLPAIRRTGTYSTPNLAPAVPKVAAVFRAYVSMARAIGLDRNQAALSAARATKADVGFDPLERLGVTHLVAPQQQPLLTPTDLGKRLGGMSAQAANALLQSRGLQEGRRIGRERATWEPTEAGRPFAVFLDTAKRHTDGTPVRQLKWTGDVLPLLTPPHAAPSLFDGAAPTS